MQNIIPEGGFFRPTDFSLYLFNQFDWPKMAQYKIYLLHRFHCVIFIFETIFITHTKCLCQIMVEYAAGLDYIKDKVAKRTKEIIFPAEYEKSVQIAWTLDTSGIESLWMLTCTVSIAFSL